MKRISFPKVNPPQFKMSKRGCGCLAGAVAGVVVLAWLYGRVQWVPAGYVGLVYNARSGIQNRVFKPQALLVGPFDQLYIYPTKLQAAIYAEDPTLGEVKAADGIQITTSDSAITVFDISVLYRVEPANVRTVFQRFGPLPIEEIQTLHIRRAVREGASAIGNQYDVFSLLGAKRQEASQKLTDELRTRLGPKGITIVVAMLNSAHPSRDIESKITGRVNSHTQLEIAKLEAQIAEIARQSSVVRAQAENQARTLTAAETQEKSLEMLRLELEEAAIEKWKKAGGHLPSVIVKPGQTVIVNGGGQAVIPGARR